MIKHFRGYFNVLLFSNARTISNSKILSGVSRTRETGIVPGSSEYFYPNLWAQRLLDLQNFKEKPEQPSKLNIVCLTQKLKGISYYQRCILQKHGLSGSRLYKFKILKNVPSVNEDLKELLHLLKVIPLTFPHGIPKTEEDFLNARIRPDGRMILHTGIRVEGEFVQDKAQLSEEDIKAIIFQPTPQSQRSLTYSDMHQKNMRDWRKYNFLKSQFTTMFQYMHNQDGKEYRYSGLWRKSEAMKQSMARRFNKDGTIRMNDLAEADWNTYPWRFY